MSLLTYVCSGDGDAEKVDRPLACEGFVMGMEQGEMTLFSCSNSGHFSRESVACAGRMSEKTGLIAARLQRSGEGIQDAIQLAAEMMLEERDQDSDDTEGYIEMRILGGVQLAPLHEAGGTEHEKQYTVRTFRTVDELRELFRNPP
jgi:20S proteasome alpha/beta subunit